MRLNKARDFTTNFLNILLYSKGSEIEQKEMLKRENPVLFSKNDLCGITFAAESVNCLTGN